MKKPSNFTNYPWNSVFENSEHETIAVNIMFILKRTGDEWRELTWEEYVEERKKDKVDLIGKLIVKKRFERVQPYTTSPEEAMNFSKYWNGE